MSVVVETTANGDASVTIDRAAAVGLLSQCEELASALRAALEVVDGPLPASLAAKLQFRFTRPDGITFVGAYVLKDVEE